MSSNTNVTSLEFLKTNKVLAIHFQLVFICISTILKLLFLDSTMKLLPLLSMKFVFLSKKDTDFKTKKLQMSYSMTSAQC